MTNRRAILTLSIPMLGAILAGCGASATSASRTVATVNGQTVSAGDLHVFVKGTEFMQGQTLPNTAQEKKLEVKAMVAQTTVNQWALKHHLTTLKKAKSAAQQFIKADIESQVGGQSGLKSLLKSKSLTESDLENFLTQEMVAQSAFNQVTKGAKPPTTAQEQAFYTANKAQFATAPEDEISQIVVKSSSLASQILKDAKAGQSFRALAKQYSIASTGKTGGSLGYQPVSAMTRSMASAVSKLKAGQFASYHDSSGYHVIWLQAVKPSGTAAFSTVKAQIAQQLQQQTDDTLYQSWTSKLEKSQKISIKP